MANRQNKQPNVIWIFGDQHRAQAVGYAGDPNLHTPNIDRLANEGITFSAVAGTPLCCPYRGSLLTGRYPHVCVPGHEMQLPPTQPTIAAPFKNAGYHTAYIGKWHLDGYKEINGRAAFHIVPPERRGGFDKWIGFENNNSQYDCWVHGGEGKSAYHYRLDGYETDCLTDLFIDNLRERAASDTPFFAVLSVQPPHNPYIAPESWMARHTPGEIELRANVPPIASVRERAQRELAGYYAMIENLDWNLGRIRTVLAETRLEWNTRIVFFSDHGDMHGCHGHFHKTSPFEESLRVPFIVGGGTPFYDVQTTHYDLPLNHVDVAPTTLGLCGIDVPDWMQGTDYSHYRIDSRPRAEEPDSAFLQYCVPPGHGNWIHGNCIDQPWRGIVTRDGWKYVAIDGQPWILFNLEEDPFELMNLAHISHTRQIKERLNARLARWIDETGDKFNLPDYGA